MKDKPFWETHSLDQMNKEQWESLCDGCALCCLHKLEDEDTAEVYYTDVHCRYMNEDSCRCTVYQERQEKVPHCVWLTPEQAHSFHWLPETCAYRLLSEGKKLYDWHPLISGSSETVHDADISIRNKGIADDQIDEELLQDRIIWKA